MNVAIVLAGFFRFVLVPLVLLGILGWAWSQTNSELRRISGFWLGILIAILVIVVSFFQSQDFTVTLSATQPFELGTGSIVTNVLIGLALGFVSMLISRTLSVDAATAALIAALAAGSLIALYEYFFNSAVRDQVLLVAISFVIGALAYVVFGPSSRR
ncbi:MAG TPA: hypothetical protein VH349_14000 [Ktedonobacterales bacterium]|jgi:hypothetical protein